MLWGMSGYMVAIGLIAALFFWRVVVVGKERSKLVEFVSFLVSAAFFAALLVGGILTFVHYGAGS